MGLKCYLSGFFPTEPACTAPGARLATLGGYPSRSSAHGGGLTEAKVTAEVRAAFQKHGDDLVEAPLVLTKSDDERVRLTSVNIALSPPRNVSSDN